MRTSGFNFPSSILSKTPPRYPLNSVALMVRTRDSDLEEK